MCKTVVEDTWDKIFVGGLPCNYADEQVCYFVTYVVTFVFVVLAQGILHLPMCKTVMEGTWDKMLVGGVLQLCE
jgi:hypothetical protein